MAGEDEKSLAKRPELIPEKLKEGGVIVGVEPSVTGSLVSMSGLALERITRERAEVPSWYKLPERPVYFLDPNSRRMISISNREYTGGTPKTPDKYGLFAEVVEIDEEGKPHYRLSTSDVILPNESFQLVAVGPNPDGLPPSYIEVEEAGGEESKEGKEKKKFVPWNVLLGQLQSWMNDVSVDPNEGPKAFIKRFLELRERTEFKAREKIEKTFGATLGGYQGMDPTTIPMNLIITDKGKDSFLYQASVRAGLYPVLAHPKFAFEVAQFMDTMRIINPNMEPLEDFDRHWSRLTDEAKDIIGYISPTLLPGRGETTSGVITIDYRSLDFLHARQTIPDVVHNLQGKLPIFSIVDMILLDNEEHPELNTESKKKSNGNYYTHYNETAYEGLLRKLKADMILTMFVRGGAPIVK